MTDTTQSVFTARRAEDCPCDPDCMFAPGHKGRARNGSLEPLWCETGEQLRAYLEDNRRVQS